MSSLIWKEYRLNLPVLLFGGVLWLAPYLIGIILLVTGAGQELSQAVWARYLAASSQISIVVSLLTFLLLGANSIASERADRSAEFLAYLPPTPAMILVSKTVLPIAVFSIVWASNLFTAFELAPALNRGAVPGTEDDAWWSLATVALLLFGSSWLGSATLDRPMTALGFGLLFSLFVAMAFAVSNSLLGWPADRLGPEVANRWYTGTYTVLGLACFALGCRLYYRRRDL
jgi:hypothetical protein